MALAATRVASSRTTPCIQSGLSTRSASSAIALYEMSGTAARWRCKAQMPRLPISSKEPPSASAANDTVMKSIDRELSTTCDLLATSSRAVPTVKATASRELHKMHSLVSNRSRCFCGRPAVPKAAQHSHCAYSPAFRPMPPAAACTMIEQCACSSARSSDSCTVHHVTGSVHASTNASFAGLLVTNAVAARAKLAIGACPRPKVAVPTICGYEDSLATTPAMSPPGGPGSPGYSPSILSTSRKLRPTACTCTSISASLRGGAEIDCDSRKRLLIAPRAWKCSLTSPYDGNRRAALSRGAEAAQLSSATSGSDRNGLQVNDVLTAESMHETGSATSCLTARPSPHSPACSALVCAIC
mmetsp:Transcript_60820/g.101046  ORF Transcript_60820/g.101046 Transcript_60820/m.101046 type:complete len:357 (-) Transcript_60820:340-1410(-)